MNAVTRSRDGSLAGRVAIVTGASGGIGRETAIALAHRGAAVVCASRDSERTRETAALIEQFSTEVAVTEVDVRLEVDNRSMVDTAIRRFGQVDIVVNVAGLTVRGAIHETSEQEWDDTMLTNLKSVYWSSRFVVPHFLERGAGNIILVASSFGLLGASGFAAYCASKGALITLAKAMALDYGPTIRVNCVCPGATDAPQVRAWLDAQDDPEASERVIGEMNAALKRLAQPSEIAEAIAFLASDSSSFVTGHALVVDGGQTIDA